MATNPDIKEAYLTDEEKAQVGVNLFTSPVLDDETYLSLLGDALANAATEKALRWVREWLREHPLDEDIHDAKHLLQLLDAAKEKA